MKISDVVKIIKNNGLEILSPEVYINPSHLCSRWILLDSVAYGKHFFEGDFLIDVEKIYEWSIGQAERTWTNQKIVELAKKYLPEWISNADLSNETPSLLDSCQLEFLRPHISTFISLNCYKAYCPVCSNWFEELVSSGQKNTGVGKIIKWRDEYQCPNGHVLYSEDEEIRVI